ncbi:MAG TPA: mechanosensitive ion channel domain-containing protein [Woeseiaceae bacterium]
MDDLQLPGANLDWENLLIQLQALTLEFGLQILLALAIFIIGRRVARLITNALHKVMQKQEIDKTLETFVCNFAYMIMLAFVVIAAINQVGVQTTSLIAVMGAAGLAVGLALQGSLSNFAAGVLIVLFRPYRVGDFVEAAGIAGTVEQVQILTTILRTGDNKQIVVPNKQIMDSIITNYSRKETRRIDLVIGVSYDDDLDKVRGILRNLVDADERILKDPECLIAVAELADSSVNFYLRPWVASGDYWTVRFDLIENIKKTFDQQGVQIPFPQRDVHIIQKTA